MNTFEIIGSILIALAGITSIFILIPQVINLHRNKYSDNSNVWLYWVYLWSNFIWTAYQIFFNVGTLNNPDHNASEIPLLSVQLSIDIISLAIGIYSLILKYHYSGKKKFVNSRKREVMAFKKSLKPQLIHLLSFLNVEITIEEKKDLITLANKLCVYTRSMQDAKEKEMVDWFVIEFFNQNKDYLSSSIQATIDPKVMKKFVHDHNTGLNKIAYAINHTDYSQKAIWLARVINYYLFLAS